jgi:hypothetical protein
VKRCFTECGFELIDSANNARITSYMTRSKENSALAHPSSATLEIMRDARFTKQQTSYITNGQEGTRLVIDGSGMIGLENMAENKEWAGLFNHCVKIAGASLKLGRLLQYNGHEIDLQLLLDTVMLSHNGRRQYEEARRYPNDVPRAEEKVAMGDTRIGLSNLKWRNVQPELVDMVAVHGVDKFYPFEAIRTWNQKLPLYLDYRIGQNVVSLDQRFASFQEHVASGRTPQETLDKAYTWAITTEKELFAALHIDSYDALVRNPQNLKARIDAAVQLGRFSESQVHNLLETKLYKPSGIDEDVVEVSGLSKEGFWGRLQLRAEDVNEKLLQPERWERYIRRLYINDAEQGIFARLSQGGVAELESEFPQNTWWGKYARELYEQRHGVPLLPQDNKQIGIARAIEFYRRIERSRLADSDSE